MECVSLPVAATEVFYNSFNRLCKHAGYEARARAGSRRQGFTAAAAVLWGQIGRRGPGATRSAIRRCARERAHRQGHPDQL